MKLCKDSQEFLSKCSGIVSSWERDTFGDEQSCFMEENSIESPIEQMLNLAFKTLMKLNFFQEADSDEVNGEMYIVGFNLKPQVSIGNYRVDFVASRHCYPEVSGQKISEVIIECDSQQFHDRTEKERRYEKIRDRFLQSKGYKIFHYTGKEIKNDPFKIAAEILSYLTGLSTDVLIDYSYIPE